MIESQGHNDQYSEYRSANIFETTYHNLNNEYEVLFTYL